MGQQNNQPQEERRQNAPGYNEQDKDGKRTSNEQDQSGRKVGTEDDQKRQQQHSSQGNNQR